MHGQVEVLADARKVPDGFDESCAGMAWVRTGESDPLHAGDRIHFSQQLGEVAGRVVGSRIVIDDLSQQLNLAPPRRDGLPDVGQDVRLGSHPLMTAGIGDDAKRAMIVAAFDDRDIRPDRIRSRAPSPTES